MQRVTRFIAALSLLVLFGCEPKDDQHAGMPVEPPAHPSIELKVLAQLSPGRTTHVTVDQLSNVYWVQENTGSGEENVMFTIGEAGVPRATQLSASNILAAMGVAPSGGSGAILDIRAAEGAIWFYFSGGKGRAGGTCLGQFFPRSGKIRIVAGTSDLAERSGMGTSLELARASLVMSGPTLWLWLRHSDVSAFLSLDPRSGAGATGVTALQRPFDRVMVDGRSVATNREELELSAGPSDSLLLLDRKKGLLWEIDPHGQATMRHSLAGLPTWLTSPIVVKDRLLVFAADFEPIGGELALVDATILPKVTYPALLKLTEPKFEAIGRDDIRPPYNGFPVYALRFQRPVREGPDRLVAYDDASGALMRITLPKDW
jgi:hypothetical protein